MGQNLSNVLQRWFFALLWFCVGLFFCWAAGAIRYLTWMPPFLGPVAGIAFFVGGLILFRKLKQKSRQRMWLTYAAAAIVGVYVLTLTQRPSNDREWAAEQAKQPNINIADGHVSIQNFRHCQFRTEADFDVTHRQFDFELNRLSSVWFLVQRFTSLNGLAHTFLSFQVDTDKGPEFFCVSVEIRREKGEVYSPIRGLYRQYELFYAIGDERDIIGQRTNMRPSDRVYMYPVNATPEQVQKLFVEIAERTTRLENKPEFYNTLLNNCTNSIVSHTYKLTPEPINPMDPRIAIPGYSSRFAYATGLIGDREKQSFRNLQDKCRIDDLARKAGLSERYSLEIRKP